ncbi:membrane protein [Paucilactobacillus hokkaidonensis JCM 18461]|uniref:Membrane protein n=2 Tax=Paucilactobacillus hokkaidonensis TaxID=1193095 RepID=A0A0A1GW77_9LACO|nr:hypothetical protein [Paucilactobacillus hokkaidonensis]KRO11124.1 hypothetical protein IV59_GL000876 [Paucilactobacillus hokkaidonensis]BAP86512.1 membrane protein [Paucilactobacillus hokkaidonensis JCM 18461]
MLQTIATTLWQTILYLIIIPGILGTGLVLINRNSKGQVVNYFGFRAQIFGGWLGIIIHETSHLLMAIIFGHHITSFRLLRSPRRNDPTDNSLGYVNHTWNQHNFYQQTGNVLIGISPIIGNTIAIYFITKWLLPATLTSWQDLLTNHEFISPMLISPTYGFLGFLLWVLLVINICLGGFDLSSADLKNSALGLISLAVFIIIIAVLVSLASWNSSMVSGLQSVMIPFITAMLFALLIAIITNLVLRLIGHFL